IEAAMSQAYVLHDGVKPDTIEPPLRNKREAVSTPGSVLGCLFACHAHRGPIPPTSIVSRSVSRHNPAGRVIDCSRAVYCSEALTRSPPRRPRRLTKV